MTSEDSFSGIHIFLATARSATFTEAAERLGLSKSAVGKAIARLEARVGTSLFYRSTRRLSLSPDGEAYYNVWSAALEDIKATEGNLGNKLGVPTGRLRVDMPVAFGKQVVLPVLLEMSKRFAQLQLTLTFSDQLVDLTEEGIDLAIRFGSVDSVPGLVARRLTSHRWVTCASPAYLAEHGTPLTLEDLAHHRGIVGYRRGSLMPWKMTQAGQPVKFSPPPTYQFDDAEAMIEAARADLGICQMPLCLFEKDIATHAVVTVLEPFEPAPVEVHALWSKSNHSRPKIRYLVDELLKLYGRD
ncbi:LysR family transcriptional regulator [Pseudomonas turukhanskensis]|uniref:LysR family transcriptional regulator n=1 Tax=Pseudomonas turukhanskensis TaxID=1806536 RepID=A0A9W6KBA2_9PSED|nr:LysR family transcriptional regulator [Pseudomonas turukhanskensis]GLK90398.1 LysR family transcriptional regulator [Pseudomonas turukhanskensis]